MILENIAQTIAQNTSSILGFPISITNEKGYIIGSTDENRLGTFHKASLDVLKKNDMVCFQEEDVRTLQNVLPGVASPILFDNKSIGVLGIVGNPIEVKKYVQLVKNHIEMMCQESYKKEMTVLESKTTDTFVQYLIQLNNTDDKDNILRYGKMLGFDLELNRVCILIDIEMLSLNLAKQNKELHDKFSFQYFQRELINYIKSMFTDHKQDIMSLLNLEQMIILKYINPKENFETFIETIKGKLDKLNDYLAKKYNFTAVVAIGNVDKGVRGIHESYQNSLKALSMGKRSNVESKVYYFNDLSILLELLTHELSSTVQKTLAKNITTLLEHDNYVTLANTFFTYCKCNMNLSETARTLFIHRNTLVYRLERIGELTSMDLTNFEHCLLLYTTIKKFEHDRSLKHEKVPYQ